VEVEALNADPSPIEALTVPAIVDHLSAVVEELDSPPILMGHSAGGAFVQLLLDRGYGSAGVAINSAPTEGVAVVPLSQVRAAFPVLEQWHYAFTNTFSEEESRALYERYHVPASGSIFWGSALANIHPGKDDTYVDYHNDDRAPLLFIAGSEDHLMPPKIQPRTRSTTSRTRSPRSRSTRAALTCFPPRRAGRKWPITRSSGPRPTR
jgi:pimeloyl-ACP methyl ester carboxylesterase